MARLPFATLGSLIYSSFIGFLRFKPFVSRWFILGYLESFTSGSFVLDYLRSSRLCLVGLYWVLCYQVFCVRFICLGLSEVKLFVLDLDHWRPVRLCWILWCQVICTWVVLASDCHVFHLMTLDYLLSRTSQDVCCRVSRPCPRLASLGQLPDHHPSYSS